MKNLYLFIWLIILSVQLIKAQPPDKPLIIKGQIVNIDNNKPVPYHKVSIISDSIEDPNFFYYKNLVSNKDGYFIDSLKLPPNLHNLKFYVQTIDCNNEYVTVTLIYTNQPSLIAVLKICEIKNTCKAYFELYKDSTINSSRYAYQFINKSEGYNLSSFWEFGDNTTSYEFNPLHKYEKPGNYKVCLVISDSLKKCTDKYCKDIFVKGFDSILNCDAQFIFNRDSIHSQMLSCNFKNISKISNNLNNTETIYSWDFGDGKKSNEINPIHIFPEPDYYNICLKVQILSIPDNIVLCESINCKDSILIGNPMYFNIGGQVFAGNFPVRKAIASIHRIKADKKIFLSKKINFDTLGYYYFYQLMEGNYFVKISNPEATNNNVKYIPTYYGNAVQWTNARKIENNNNNFSLEIHLFPEKIASGNGSISGYVYNSKNNDRLKNIEVLIFDTNLTPLGYLTTDNNGSFSFNNIAYGTYILTTDETGWISLNQTITIDNNNPAKNTSLSLKNDFVKTDIEENNKEQNSFTCSIYPNPANDYINIDITNHHQDEIFVEIFTLEGISLFYKNYFFYNTKNSLNIPTNNFVKGLYFIKLSNKSNQLSIVKKLIKN